MPYLGDIECKAQIDLPNPFLMLFLGPFNRILKTFIYVGDDVLIPNKALYVRSLVTLLCSLELTDRDRHAL